MPDFNLLGLLLSSVDQKQLLLICFLELQIQLLHRRLPGRLLPDGTEKANLDLLYKEIDRPDLATCLSFLAPTNVATRV